MSRTRLAALITTCLLLLSLGVAAPASALSGGTALPTGQRLTPWFASLVVKGDQPLADRVSCGGALIGPRTVLTAAHCTDGLSTAQVATQAEVHVGATTLSRDPGTVRGIVDVRVHPKYRIIPSPAAPDQSELSSATYDVEVLTLDRPITGVRPLTLSTEAPRSGRLAVLLGHGISRPDTGPTDALRSGLFTTGRLDRCATATPATVDSAAMTCATSTGFGRAAACFGDSGGPLVSLDRHGRPVLLGVFSFGMETAGKQCGAAGPDFFTRSDIIAAWL